MINKKQGQSGMRFYVCGFLFYKYRLSSFYHRLSAFIFISLFFLFFSKEIDLFKGIVSAAEIEPCIPEDQTSSNHVSKCVYTFTETRTVLRNNLWLF